MSVLFTLVFLSTSSVLQTAKNLTLFLLLSELTGFLLWPMCLVSGAYCGMPYMFAFSVSLILMGAMELVLVSMALVKTA